MIHKHLNKENDYQKVPTTNPKDILPVEANEVISRTKMDVMKLKDFIISGSIGNVGEKDKLS